MNIFINIDLDLNLFMRILIFIANLIMEPSFHYVDRFFTLVRFLFNQQIT